MPALFVPPAEDRTAGLAPISAGRCGYPLSLGEEVWAQSRDNRVDTSSYYRRPN